MFFAPAEASGISIGNTAGTLPSRHAACASCRFGLQRLHPLLSHTMELRSGSSVIATVQPLAGHLPAEGYTVRMQPLKLRMQGHPIVRGALRLLEFRCAAGEIKLRLLRPGVQDMRMQHHGCLALPANACSRSIARPFLLCAACLRAGYTKGRLSLLLNMLCSGLLMLRLRRSMHGKHAAQSRQGRHVCINR